MARQAHSTLVCHSTPVGNHWPRPFIICGRTLKFCFHPCVSNRYPHQLIVISRLRKLHFCRPLFLQICAVGSCSKKQPVCENGNTPQFIVLLLGNNSNLKRVFRNNFYDIWKCFEETLKRQNPVSSLNLIFFEYILQTKWNKSLIFIWI